MSSCSRVGVSLAGLLTYEPSLPPAIDKESSGKTVTIGLCGPKVPIDLVQQAAAKLSSDGRPKIDSSLEPASNTRNTYEDVRWEKLKEKCPFNFEVVSYGHNVSHSISVKLIDAAISFRCLSEIPLDLNGCPAIHKGSRPPAFNIKYNNIDKVFSASGIPLQGGELFELNGQQLVEGRREKTIVLRDGDNFFHRCRKLLFNIRITKKDPHLPQPELSSSADSRSTAPITSCSPAQYPKLTNEDHRKAYNRLKKIQELTKKDKGFVARLKKLPVPEKFQESIEYVRGNPTARLKLLGDNNHLNPVLQRNMNTYLKMIGKPGDIVLIESYPSRVFSSNYAPLLQFVGCDDMALVAESEKIMYKIEDLQDKIKNEQDPSIRKRLIEELRELRKKEFYPIVVEKRNEQILKTIKFYLDLGKNVIIRLGDLHFNDSLYEKMKDALGGEELQYVRFKGDSQVVVDPTSPEKEYYSLQPSELASFLQQCNLPHSLLPGSSSSSCTSSSSTSSSTSPSEPNIVGFQLPDGSSKHLGSAWFSNPGQIRVGGTVTVKPESDLSLIPELEGVEHHKEYKVISIRPAGSSSTEKGLYYSLQPSELPSFLQQCNLPRSLLPGSSSSSYTSSSSTSSSTSPSEPNIVGFQLPDGSSKYLGSAWFSNPGQIRVGGTVTVKPESDLSLIPELEGVEHHKEYEVISIRSAGSSPNPVERLYSPLNSVTDLGRILMALQ